MPYITAHAIERYIERVEPVDAAMATATIRAAFPCISKACEFGCDTVVMGNGARLVLSGDVVVTVLPKRFRKEAAVLISTKGKSNGAAWR